MRTAFVLLSLTIIPASAATYDYLTFAGPAGAEIHPLAINNSGVIVGYYLDSSGAQHGFLRAADGTMTTLDVPGAAVTVPASNSSTGWIAGSYATPCCQPDHGFRLAPDGKTLVTFQVNGDATLAIAVNSSGQVTGYANGNGFVTSDGQKFDTFQDAGGATYPTWINDRGDIVGFAYDNYHTQAFRRTTDGTVANIGLGLGSQAVAINNSYQIVGAYPVPGAGVSAYLRSATGGMINLKGSQAIGINNNGQVIGSFGPFELYNPDGTYDAVAIPGAASSAPAAINDSGQITGTYTITDDKGNGRTYGYLAVPMPASPGPAIRNFHGVTGASGFGALLATAPGSWIEIYGEGLAGTTRSWQASDFIGNVAPTSLDGVTVAVNGQPAYVAYVSPEQVNAQVPESVAPGAASVTVSYGGVTSRPQTIAVNVMEPALLTVNGCVAPVFADGTRVETGCLPFTVPQRVAHEGDVIVFYGVGFGAVTPPVPPGAVVPAPNQLQTPFAVNWSNLGVTTPGQVQYAGLAPGSVGLYQFNVVVPPVSDVSAGGAAGITGTWTLNGATQGTFPLLVAK